MRQFCHAGGRGRKSGTHTLKIPRPSTAMDSLVVVVRVPPASLVSDMRAISMSGGETTAEESEKSQVATGKRKSSYHLQREEIVRLRREAEELDAKLREAQLRQSDVIIQEHVTLDRQVAMNKLVIAGAQSLVAHVGSMGERAPIGSYTHLPVDQLDRERIIKAIKPKQIEDATMYMLARCKYADLSRPSRHVEHFTTVDGDQIAVLWEIAHITEGKPTARVVFDEIQQFTRTRKMALADRLSKLDIQESGPTADTADLVQLRVLSTHSTGLPVEKNVLSHSQFFAKSAVLEKPYGIFVADPVDEDDAFPYDPCDRIRQDSTSALLVMDLPKGARQHQPTVVLAMFSFARTHWSHLASAEQLAQIADDGLRACFDVTVQRVRQQLRSREAATTVEDEDPTTFIDKLLRDAQYVV